MRSLPNIKIRDRWLYVDGQPLTKEKSMSIISEWLKSVHNHSDSVQFFYVVVCLFASEFFRGVQELSFVVIREQNVASDKIKVLFHAAREKEEIAAGLGETAQRSAYFVVIHQDRNKQKEKGAAVVGESLCGTEGILSPSAAER